LWREQQNGAGSERRQHLARQCLLGYPCGELLQQAIETAETKALAQTRRVAQLDQQQAAAGRDARARGQLARDAVEQHVAVDQRLAAVDHTRATLHGRARAAHAIADRGDQVLGPHRLGDEIIAAGIQRGVLAIGVRIAGKKHDGCGHESLALTDQRGQLEAIGAGHVDVHQDQVGLEAFQLVQRGQRLDHGARMHAGPAQHGFGEGGLGGIVVDHQHAVGCIADFVLEQRLGLRQQRVQAQCARQGMIGTGAQCIEACAQIVVFENGQQRDAVSGLDACVPQRRGQQWQRRQCARADHQQPRRRIAAQRDEHALDVFDLGHRAPILLEVQRQIVQHRVGAQQQHLGHGGRRRSGRGRRDDGGVRGGGGRHGHACGIGDHGRSGGPARFESAMPSSRQ